MQILGFADDKLIMTHRMEFVSGGVDEMWEVEDDGYQVFIPPPFIFRIYQHGCIYS